MDQVNIKNLRDGVEFDVFAKPNARTSRIGGLRKGAVQVEIAAAPEKGKANEAILKLLSRLLKVPVSAISITGGKTSRHKRVRIAGITAEQVQRLISGQVT